MRRPQRRSSARLRRRSRPPVPVKARSSPANGQRAIAMVADTRMDRILRRAGWPLKRLGAPCTIGSTEAVAGLLAVTDDTLRVICASAGVSGRVLPGGIGSVCCRPIQEDCRLAHVGRTGALADQAG